VNTMIEYLADHPEFVPTLARWHHAEWSSLLPDWSRETAESELRSHTKRCNLPTTVVAIENFKLLGSASLLVTDLEGFEHLTPWLASVFVAPDFRGRGIGEALVRRIISESANIGHRSIYLWTAGQAEYYRRLGWEILQRTERQGNKLVIMHRLIGDKAN
jgi:predicted N-acetyltransferase YhbS